jgi:hypothetical protein
VRTFLRLTRYALLLGQLGIIAISLYQSSITALGYVRERRRKEPLPPERLPRFGLIVCARNEEAVIGRIVRDLLNLDYPSELREVLVVAHNCTDGTASAAARAGATVVEHITATAGKGHAIAAGMRELTNVEFVGVFDADARIREDMLSTIARYSAGETCLQAETVPIADEEWLAEGYGFGRKARNLFWWRPREALGLNTNVTGCGWFIRPEVYERYERGSWTMTEDLELTARLVADGFRVRYVSAAQVAVGEPRNIGSSWKQRSRWVRGHLGVVRGRWPRLLRRAALGDRQALDLAIYLVVPTRMLTRLGVTAAAIIALAGAPFAVTGWLLAPALAGEWLVPAWIAWRERLLRLSSGSVRLALEHSVLSLLWFPIGAWALATARINAWHPTQRNLEPDPTHVP